MVSKKWIEYRLSRRNLIIDERLINRALIAVKYKESGMVNRSSIITSIYNDMISSGDSAAIKAIVYGK